MNNEQKRAVCDLRVRGLAYTQIAEDLGVSVNTVKSFCQRHDVYKRPCKNCGKPLSGKYKRKPKLFCDDHCRQAWWRENRDKIRHTAVSLFTCRHCKQVFERYGKKERKYCSRACYHAHRYGVP